MSIDKNDTYIEFSLKELSKDDCDYAILNKLLSLLQGSIKNSGATAAIGICREGQQEVLTSPYCILESSSGETIGLRKIVNDRPEPITLALPGEIRVLKGSGVGPLEIPTGWRLVEDESIRRKYNIGQSPNWEAAAIEKIG